MSFRGSQQNVEGGNQEESEKSDGGHGTDAGRESGGERRTIDSGDEEMSTNVGRSIDGERADFDQDGFTVSLKERRKKVREFARFVSTAAEVEKELKGKLSMTKLSKMEKISVIEPVTKFCEELRERFEESGRDKWQRAVIRLMRSNQIENVAMLGEVVANARHVVDEGAEKLKEEVGRLKNELSSLQADWKTESEEFKRRIVDWEQKKNSAENCLREWKRELKKEQVANEELKKTILKLQKELKDHKKEEKEKGERIKETGSSESSGNSEGGRKVRFGRDESAVRKVEEWDMDGRSGSLPNSANGWMQSMSYLMKSTAKASALPAPTVFDGSGDFVEFKRSFLLKFQSVTDTDEELVAILEGKFLEGSAKSIFKSLRGRYERPIKDLFEEFEKKLRKRQGDAKSDALNVFESLQRDVGEKLWEFCIRLEKWSLKAYSEVGRETMSQMRTTKLMKAVRDDRTLHQLLIMKRFEVPVEEQYEQLKDIVLQNENEQRREAEQMSDRRNSSRRKLSAWNKTDEPRENVQAKNEEHSQVEEKDESRAGEANKCFNCGGSGHFAWQCASRVVRRIDVRKKVCEKMGMMEKQSEIVGREMVEVVEIMGQKRKIVIDSGTAVSVMSSGMWNRLKRGCRDWKSRVEMIGESELKLLDASKRKMSLIGQIKTTIRIRKRRAMVVFQLVEDHSDLLLLGTNAFRSMGVELRISAGDSESRIPRSVGGWKGYHHLLKTNKRCAGEQTFCREEELENSIVNVREKIGVHCVEKVENDVENTISYRSRDFAPPGVDEVEKNGAASELMNEGAWSKSKKTVIKEQVVVIAPRRGWSSKAVFEYRKSRMDGWSERFDWSNVEKVMVMVEWMDNEDSKKLVKLVQDVATQVNRVTVVPIKMKCNFKDVPKITKQWIEVLKKYKNVTVVDPMLSVGAQRTPLILTKCRGGSIDQVLEFVRRASPGHALIERLRRDVDASEAEKAKGQGARIF